MNVSMQILASISGIRKTDDQVSEVEPNFFLMYTWSAFDMYSRLNDTNAQQLVLVKNFASSKSCNPKHLLQIGLEASQGPRSNPEVAMFALNTSLSTLVASPSPDYQTIALIIRKLISTGTIHKGDPGDESIMEMYKKAYRIMVGLREGEYPTEEAKWLATTAWNQAAVPVKLGQIELAKKWMNIGLELAMKFQSMQTYRSCMEEYLAGLEKKLSGESRNAAV